MKKVNLHASVYNLIKHSYLIILCFDYRYEIIINVLNRPSDASFGNKIPRKTIRIKLCCFQKTTDSYTGDYSKLLCILCNYASPTKERV